MTNIPLCDKYLFVVTDIHGDYDVFCEYLDLWLEDTTNHIVFTGDLIHNDYPGVDGSCEILDLVRVYNEYPTFHVLLGNHEWSQIWGDECYRYFFNQCEEFYKTVETKYPDNTWSNYNDYINLLKEFDYYLTTSNGFFISHTGIHEDYLESIISDGFNVDEFTDITGFDKKLITECIWSRPYDDYTEDTIQKFLDYMGLEYMVCGHTPFNPCHILGNQLIFDNSHEKRKYYLKLKLNTPYKDIVEVMKQLHELKLKK